MRQTLLALLLLSALPAAAGPVMVETTVRSQAMGTDVDVWALLPPSYPAGRAFPVVYFLHDGMGDERVLKRRGIAEHLWLLMKERRLPEFILVAPRGSQTWFIDSFDGRVRFGSFLEDELVPFVDRTWKTIPEKAGRSVFGISMGGYGAVRWGLARPDLFSSIGVLSGALQQMTFRSFRGFPFFIRPSVLRSFGDSPLQEKTQENDIYQILLSDPTLASRLPPIFVRCGDEDGYALNEVAGFFRDFLHTLRVPSEVIVEPGTHDWPYWRAAVPKLLFSLTQGLRAAPSLPATASSGPESKE